MVATARIWCKFVCYRVTICTRWHFTEHFVTFYLVRCSLTCNAIWISSLRCHTKYFVSRRSTTCHCTLSGVVVFDTMVLFFQCSDNMKFCFKLLGTPQHWHHGTFWRRGTIILVACVTLPLCTFYSATITTIPPNLVLLYHSLYHAPATVSLWYLFTLLC